MDISVSSAEMFYNLIMATVPLVKYARLSGVHATDWSWGALIFDMDNDGLKDIFVANGIYKELLNQDYVNFASNPNLKKEISTRKGFITTLIDSIPTNANPELCLSE